MQRENPRKVFCSPARLRECKKKKRERHEGGGALCRPRVQCFCEGRGERVDVGRELFHELLHRLDTLVEV